MKRVGQILLLLILLIQQGAGAEPGERDLFRINQALREWLVLIEADQPYLVVDCQALEVRLEHGRAVLRQSAVRVDSLGARLAGRADLQSRIRRYRPSDPWALPRAGPFDWEQNLVQDGPGDGALYFTNGLLLYASEDWGRPRAPALKIDAGDLRALYNVAARGLPLVVLPPRWNEDSADGGS